MKVITTLQNLIKQNKYDITILSLKQRQQLGIEFLEHKPHSYLITPKLNDVFKPQPPSTKKITLTNGYDKNMFLL